MKLWAMHPLAFVAFLSAISRLHVVRYALGGSADPNNLRLLCAAHHRHRHRRCGDASRLGRGNRYLAE